MSNLLTQLNAKADNMSPSGLLKLVVIIFVVFVPIGLLVGKLMSLSLNFPEKGNDAVVADNNTNPSETYYEGTITYVNPNTYPQDKITYVLKDRDGNDIILLKSYDQKLTVAEGHNAKVYGAVSKSSDGSKKILIVSKVVIVNASN